jgi:hemoglobin
MLTERQSRASAEIAERDVAAAHFIERAERIAQSLERAIAVSHGVLLANGARCRRPDSERSLPARAETPQPA